MRHLSFRPALTMRGRAFRGLRGWAGKPLHPPLTDIPVGAYMLAAAFDVISAVGHEQEWSRDFYRAASFTLIGGAAVSVLAALTIGASIGGSIAYDYGFNVERVGDHAVWHRSEVDVFPGDKTEHDKTSANFRYWRGGRRPDNRRAARATRSPALRDAITYPCRTR